MRFLMFVYSQTIFWSLIGLMFHRRALHENYFHAIDKIKPTDVIQNHEIWLLNTHSFLHWELAKYLSAKNKL